MGGAGALLLMQMARRNRGPSWCERNDCQCPCHRERWLDSWFGVIFVLSSAVGGAMFAIITLMNWVDSGGTLVHTAAEEFRWFWHMLHMIW